MFGNNAKRDEIKESAPTVAFCHETRVTYTRQAFSVPQQKTTPDTRQVSPVLQQKTTPDTRQTFPVPQQKTTPDGDSKAFS